MVESNIGGKPLPTDPHFVDEQEPRYMNEEDYGRMPDRFRDYATLHPDILPDYRPFAQRLIGMVDRTRDDEIIALTGPQGIGKTRLIAPAILGAAKQKGYKPLGSLTVMDIGDYPVIFLNAHEWLVDKGETLGKNALVYYTHGAKLEQVKRHIAGTFNSAQGERKIFMLDEFGELSEVIPELATFISDRARLNNVRLVGLAPKRDTKGANPDVASDIIRENDSRLKLLSETSRLAVMHAPIPEQLAPIAAIATLLETYGIDEEVLGRFERNTHLRRLGVIEVLVDHFFSQRKTEEPGGTSILSHDDLQSLARSIRIDVDHPQPFDYRRVGLTKEAYIKMMKDLLE